MNKTDPALKKKSSAYPRLVTTSSDHSHPPNYRHTHTHTHTSPPNQPRVSNAKVKAGSPWKHNDFLLIKLP